MSDLAYIIESAIVEHDETDGDMGPLALSLAIAKAVKRGSMDNTLYRRRCDSVVHEAEGEWLEDDTQKEGAQEPITDKCLDWHPDLVWYEAAKADSEAL